MSYWHFVEALTPGVVNVWKEVLLNQLFRNVLPFGDCTTVLQLYLPGIIQLVFVLTSRKLERKNIFSMPF